MVQYFEWLPFLDHIEGVANINNEVAIFTYSEIMSQLKEVRSDYLEMLRRPHKFDCFMVVNHLAGGIKFKIDMEEYEETGGNHIINCAPGQIISIDSITDDFDAHILVLSERFIESMLVFLNGSIPLRFDMRRQAVVECSDDDMKMQDLFVKAVRFAISDKDNPYRLPLVQHVMMAIFYASDKPRSLGNTNDSMRTNADVLTKQFMELVKANFRKERQLQFYADALCITPRYLSRVVKECTGSSAADWIERYVVLEARALLKSTTMTIQQISDELNFPSQTFFGKYFKRRVGMSPKDYRRVG